MRKEVRRRSRESRPQHHHLHQRQETLRQRLLEEQCPARHPPAPAPGYTRATSPSLPPDEFDALARMRLTTVLSPRFEPRRFKAAVEQTQRDERPLDQENWLEVLRQVAQPRTELLTPVELLAPPAPLPRQAMQDFARCTFVPKRQVVVNFSPFAG